MILYVLSDKPISTKNVTEWLDSLGMSTYEPMFFANGFDSIDFLVCSSFFINFLTTMIFIIYLIFLAYEKYF